MKVAGDVKATDFARRTVKSGSSIEAGRTRTAAARLTAERAPETRIAVGIAAEPPGPRETVPAVRAGRRGAGGDGPDR